VAEANKGVQVVSVSSGPRETQDTVKQFLADKNYNWPFLHVEAQESIPYDNGAIPSIFVIDAEGTIQSVMVGGPPAGSLQEQIDKARNVADPAPDITTDQVAEFVPVGKVRHIVITERGESNVAADPPVTVSRDIWFGNGTNHLVMHYTAVQNRWSFVPVKPGISVYGAAPREGWLTDDAVYVHVKGEEDIHPAANVVLKYPYDSSYLMRFGPNPNAVSDLQERYHKAQLIEVTVLDNHPVRKVVVDHSTEQTSETSAPGTDQSSQTSRVATYWIDVVTGQYRRSETVTKSPLGSDGEMRVFTSTMSIEREELLDASQLEPGYFDFKLPEGATLIERNRQMISFGYEVPSSDWFEHIDVLGNFSVRMPRTPDFSYNSSGLTTIGAKRNGVTYGVKHLDAGPGTPTPNDPVSLNRTFDMAKSEGTVLSEQDITLGAYPGKEYRIRDNSDNYLIWRVYAAGQRVYTVFAIAPDETTDAATIRDFFDSFKLLNP
jgi:hypothetical protein